MGMASRLPVSQRLPGQAKKPQELLSWTKCGDQAYYDDRALRYYYLPRTEIERNGIDLSIGFDRTTFKPDEKKATFIDGVLKALIRLETTNKTKTPAQIVCWRGLLTSLLVRSQQHADRYAAQEELQVEVVKYDGQIFLCQITAPDVPSTDSGGDPRFVYSGYRFEEIATLPKPWGECTREEIEARYTSKSSPDLANEYCVLVKSGVGGIDCVYGAEVDCVEHPKTGTKDYIELKTSKVVMDTRGAAAFERKLMRTWIQSFLVGIPRVIYGFRDDDFILRAVEEIRIQSMPGLIKNSRVTRPEQRWNGNDIIAFYNVLAHWLCDRVEEGKTYLLTCPSYGKDMRLQPTELDHGRKVAFLSDEFVEWRKSLAETN